MSSFAGIRRLNRKSNQELLITLLRLEFNSSSGLVTSESGITAFAGGGQTGATALTKRNNRIDTVASSGDSVKPNVNATVGFSILIQNNGANNLDFFPAVGDTIAGNAINTAISIAAGNQAMLFCYTNSQLTLI